MKFGQSENPRETGIPEGQQVLRGTASERIPVLVGLGQWNRTKIKNFYPRNTGSELAYYSTQFNSIELNATFYRIFPPTQIKEWREISAPHFTFVPKIPHEVSHIRRLRDYDEIIEKFVESISNFGDKLGPVFLQNHEAFGPPNFDRLQGFVDAWKKFNIPLAIEVRSAEWHEEPFADEYYAFLRENDVSNILIDTAGRRDLMHMSLTTPTAFIRFVGCNNDEIDYKRLDAWAARISEWQNEGLVGLIFFLHQHDEKESAKLAAHFVEKLNELGVTDLEPPTVYNSPGPYLKP